MGKLDPEVFMGASHWLALRNSAKCAGLCGVIFKASPQTNWKAYVTLLNEMFGPEGKANQYFGFWWHYNGNTCTKKTQEERFIALCLLYEIAKDMQND